MQSKVIFEGKLTWIGRDTDASFWDIHWINANKKFFLKARLPWYVKHAISELPPRASLIEAGCGAGFIARALAKRGYDVFGVDYAEETINFQKDYFPHIKLFCQDVRALNFNDNAFDAYLSLGVIEHFRDENDVLVTIKEGVRVTKPGGVLFISVPFTNFLREKKIRKGIYEQIKEIPGEFYQRSYTVPQFKQLFFGLPLKLKEIIFYDAVEGICREIISLSFLRKFIALRIILRLLNQHTRLLDNYCHMVAFKFLNTK